MPMIQHETAQAAVEGVIEDPSSWTGDSTLAFERHGVRIEIAPGAKTGTEAKWGAMTSILGADGDVAQTLIYVLSQITLHVMRGENDVPLSINEILTWKGYTRHRKGDYLPNVKRAEAQNLQLISKWVFTYTSRDKIKAGSRYLRRDVIRRSPIFTFSETQSFNDTARNSGKGPAAGMAVLEAPNKSSTLANKSNATALELPLYATESEIPYNVTISPGAWVKKLIADGRIKYLPEALGKYSQDIPSERLALRIAFQIFFYDLQSFTIGEILELAREPVPKVKLQRFEDHFYEALNLLKRDGMYADWSITFQPDKPDRHWIPTWLTWRIELAPNEHA